LGLVGVSQERVRAELVLATKDTTPTPAGAGMKGMVLEAVLVVYVANLPACAVTTDVQSLVTEPAELKALTEYKYAASKETNHHRHN